MSLDQPSKIEFDASGISVGIVASRFNESLVNSLLDNALEALTDAGVKTGDIVVIRVPGANEIPYAIAGMARSRTFDVLIALGLVLAGETNHHEIIGQSTAQMLHKIAYDEVIPVINGIVTVNNMQQAEDRCGKKMNRGKEFAESALEMVLINHIFDEDEIYGDSDDPYTYQDERDADNEISFEDFNGDRS